MITRIVRPLQDIQEIGLDCVGFLAWCAAAGSAWGAASTKLLHTDLRFPSGACCLQGWPDFVPVLETPLSPSVVHYSPIRHVFAVD